MLLAGSISAVMESKLPGPGTIYIKHELHFLASVRVGDTITARAELTAIVPEKNRPRFKTWCLNQDGKTVLDGEAIVRPPKSPNKQPRPKKA